MRMKKGGGVRKERRERTYVQIEASNVIYLIPQQLLG
jgi:hypothetical protein